MARRQDFEHSFHEWNSGTYRAVAYNGSDGEGAYAEVRNEPDQHYLRRNPDRAFALGDQGTLFDSIPADHKVVGLYSSRGARHAVPTLLGLVGHRSMQRDGRLPDASSNLSVHSAPVVQNLVDRGVIKNPQSGPHVVAQNNIRVSDEMDDEAVNEAKGVEVFGRRVDPKDVRMGQQFIRSVLRRPRERVEGPVPELFPSAAYKKGAK